MKISVIIPIYNRSWSFERALSSVVDQSYNPFEIIVVDDGSDAREAKKIQEIIESYQKKITDIILLTQNNRGVSAARNLGVRESRGDWMAFLDSDDEWLEKKLELQKREYEKTGLDLIHGEEKWIRKGIRVNPKKKHYKEGGDIFLRSLDLCLISPSAVMINRDLYEKYGGFDEDFIVCEDYDLWLKITCENSVAFVEEPLLKKYGGHEDQLSQRYKAMDYFRVKSMAKIYRDFPLEREKKEILQKKLLKKCEILLKGYKKHSNFKNFDEIHALYNKFKTERLN